MNAKKLMFVCFLLMIFMHVKWEIIRNFKKIFELLQPQDFVNEATKTQISIWNSDTKYTELIIIKETMKKVNDSCLEKLSCEKVSY